MANVLDEELDLVERGERDRNKCIECGKAISPIKLNRGHSKCIGCRQRLEKKSISIPQLLPRRQLPNALPRRETEKTKPLPQASRMPMAQKTNKRFLAVKTKGTHL